MEIKLYDGDKLSTKESSDVLSFISNAFEYDFQKLENATYRILATVNEKIVAHAALSSRIIKINQNKFNTLLLGQVCTMKSLRGNGIGSRLLQNILSLKEISNYELIILNCGDSVSQFYISNQFTKISKNASYDRDGKIEVDADPVLCFTVRDIPQETLHSDIVHLGCDF